MPEHTYQIEISGLKFRVEHERDNDMDAPWKEHDGHGPVSDWANRNKKPGELILNESRWSKKYYDFQEACKIALRDGWDAKPYNTGNETKRQQAAKAARADFEHLRAWCADEWHWCGVIVKLLDDDGEETGEDESCWGYESDDEEYLASEARNMAENIAKQVRKVSDYRREGRIVRDSMIDCRGV